VTFVHVRRHREDGSSRLQRVYDRPVSLDDTKARRLDEDRKALGPVL